MTKPKDSVLRDLYACFPPTRQFRKNSRMPLLDI